MEDLKKEHCLFFVASGTVRHAPEKTRHFFYQFLQVTKPNKI